MADEPSPTWLSKKHLNEAERLAAEVTSQPTTDGRSAIVGLAVAHGIIAVGQELRALRLAYERNNR